MPKRDTTVHGAPCWVDLSTTDQPGARTFYGELFGWESTEPNEEFGGYLNFSKDGELVAGCMGYVPEMGGVPNVWGVYLAVTDSDAVAKAVEANGGQVLAPPMAVGDLGTMAVYIDPAGAVIGTWEAGTHLGIGTVAEPGTPSWFELHTKGHDAAVEFYRNVFGWTTTNVGDTDDFRYTIFDGPGEAQYAGVMDASSFLPEAAPSYWTVYIEVADVDATAAKAVELGGGVPDQPEDTPYGRLATITDHAGARLRLRGPNVAEAGAQ
jgi:predicted enzyme related to lactoylglutathione lyase